MNIYDVLILGSGPAGYTAGIYTARAGLKTLLFSGPEKGGQLSLTTAVENYPGFEQGILGPELMARLEKQARRFGTEVVDEAVTRVDFKVKPFRVYLMGKTQINTDGRQIGTDTGGEAEYQGRAVIIASGASARELGVDGESRLRGKGVSYCAVCDGFFFKDKKAAVVGGGDWALEEALTLSKLVAKVYLVHRRDEFRASRIMQERVFKNDKIEIVWNSEVLEILGKEKVQGVVLETKKMRKIGENGEMRGMGEIRGIGGELIEDREMEFVWRLPVEGVFIAVGHKPNTEFLKGQIDLDERGYVKLNNHYNSYNNYNCYRMMASVEGVFAAGDVHDVHYRQAVTAAGYGCMAALEVERWLGEKGGEKIK